MPKILIADDSAANRLSLKLELEAHGFEVTEAEDGKQALDILSASTFDAVVTDIWMPGVDGVDVVKAIRKLDEKAIVFVVTGGGPGLSIASVIGMAELWGASGYYVKPFDIRKLVADLQAKLSA